jgi:uncharacterized protein (TIGR02246 family)
MNTESKAITHVLELYRGALKAADSRAAVELFAVDGVLMAPDAPPSIGSAAIRKAYDAIFQAVALDIQFTVAEVVVMSPDWAFARTTSAGTVTIRSSAATLLESNQELFIFTKDRTQGWKFARYSFSVMAAPPK